MGNEFGALEAAGVAVRFGPAVKVGSLRYFDAEGEFAGGLAALLGGPIPAALSASRRDLGDGSDVILVWRSPSEIWVVSGNSSCHAALERYAAGCAGGCFVEQTGGIVLLSVTGTQAVSLLSRLAAITAIPRPGQALSARFADLGVTAVCLQPDQILLFIERVYAAHVWAWIRATLADWPANPGIAGATRLKEWDGSG